MKYTKIINVGSLNKANIELTIPSVVEIVEKIFEIHKNMNGIIYCNNLLISDAIEKSKKIVPRLKTLYLDQPGSNENILEKYRFNRYSENTVILSPSGVLPIIEENKAEFTIIAKLPWGDIGDPEIAKLAKSKSNIYKEMMVNTFLEQLENKSDKDHITYILDETVKYFVLDRFSHLVPKKLKELFAK
jgi:hypothetical protein